MSLTLKEVVNTHFQSVIKKISDQPKPAQDAFKFLKWVQKMEKCVKDINILYSDMKLKNPDKDPLQDEEFLKVLENECGLGKLPVILLASIDLTVAEASAVEKLFEDL